MGLCPHSRFLAPSPSRPCWRLSPCLSALCIGLGHPPEEGGTWQTLRGQRQSPAPLPGANGAPGFRERMEEGEGSGCGHHGSGASEAREEARAVLLSGQGAELEPRSSSPQFILPGKAAEKSPSLASLMAGEGAKSCPSFAPRWGCIPAPSQTDGPAPLQAGESPGESPRCTSNGPAGELMLQPREGAAVTGEAGTPRTMEALSQRRPESPPGLSVGSATFCLLPLHTRRSSRVCKNSRKRTDPASQQDGRYCRPIHRRFLPLQRPRKGAGERGGHGVCLTCHQPRLSPRRPTALPEHGQQWFLSARQEEDPSATRCIPQTDIK